MNARPHYHPAGADVLVVDIVALSVMASCILLREVMAPFNARNPSIGLPCWAMRLGYLQLATTLHACLLLRFCLLLLKFEEKPRGFLLFLATVRGRLVVLISAVVCSIAGVFMLQNVHACLKEGYVSSTLERCCNRMSSQSAFHAAGASPPAIFNAFLAVIGYSRLRKLDFGTRFWRSQVSEA
jgi:hypothetical protein